MCHRHPVCSPIGCPLLMFALFSGAILLTPRDAWAQAASGGIPRAVILDTDPSFDPDDVGCMAMLHTMASLGECRILAVINSIHHKEGSISISAINDFYGRPAIPVGDYKAYRHEDAPTDVYSHMLAKEYPHRLTSHEQAIDSVALYREILATAPPRSITIVVIGTMHNLSALLKSEPCPFSPLSGVDLVAQKVQQVVTMGGNFIDGKGHDRTNWGGSDALCEYTSWSCLDKERNAMCRFVIENCRAPFVASGWEVGCGDYHDAGRGTVKTGQALKQLDSRHIVRRSYEYHFATRGGAERIDRHSNDQCALLYAIRGEGENFKAHLDGDIELTATGDCLWTATPHRGQGYIQKNRSRELIADEIEALMMGVRAAKQAFRPQPPTKLLIRNDGRSRRLTWQPAEADPGSWVIGYRVYSAGKLLGMAYGTQFVFDATMSDALSREVKPRELKSLEVRSVSADGQESVSATR